MIALRRRPQPALHLLLGALVLALAALLALAATHSPPNARPASPRAAPVEAQPAAVMPGATIAPSSVPEHGAGSESAAAPQLAPQKPPAAQAAPAAPAAPAQRPGIATTAPPESDDQQLPH